MDITTISMILAAVLAVSEALSMIPAVKSNGVFQAVYNLLKTVRGNLKKTGLLK